MCHLMTDHYADSTIVESIIGIHIKERILKDTRREANLVGSWIIIGIYRLRSHQPLIFIHRLTGFSYHLCMLPLVGTFYVSPIGIVFNFKRRIIFPFVRVADLYMEGSQFFQCFFFGLITHPGKLFDTFTQRSLQVFHQPYHTFFGCSREIFLYIHLSHCLT